MLNLELSRLDHTVPAVVADASKITDEGMALVISGALTGGDGINVKPSSNTSGERFYGVSMFERRPPTAMPDVFEFTMPGTLSDDLEVAELPHTPTDGTILVFDNDAALSFGNPSTAGTAGLIIDGKAVKVKSSGTGNANQRWFTSADTAVAASSKIRIQYAYAPTVTQQVALVGTSIDLTPLGAGAAVTCIRKGIVFTTHYNTAKEYEIGDQIGTWTSGRFTDDSAIDIATDRATVIHVPSVANPFLGIELL